MEHEVQSVTPRATVRKTQRRAYSLWRQLLVPVLLGALWGDGGGRIDSHDWSPGAQARGWF